MATSSGHSEREIGICLQKQAFYCSTCRVEQILSLCLGLGGEHENHGKVSCLAELVHPLLHQQHQVIHRLCRISLLPLQLWALKVFHIFSCKVGGFKVWSLGQSGHFFMWIAKSTLRNKGSGPPDKLRSMLNSMRLRRASILAGFPDFVCFSAQTQQCVFPWSRSLNCFSAEFFQKAFSLQYMVGTENFSWS